MEDILDRKCQILLGNVEFRRLAFPNFYSKKACKSNTICCEIVRCNHYENLPMQYTEIFKIVKNEKFQ